MLLTEKIVHNYYKHIGMSNYKKNLIHRFFSLSSFVIPRRCLKNFICAASNRCSSLFFSTQASLQNFNAA
jgi:hypothetical protein